MKTATLLSLALLTAPALAQETRDLDAHEHGVGKLNIAVDGSDVAMELHAPGSDIVGFEYTATSDEDRAAIDTALSQLERPLDLFTVPGEAACALTQATAELEGGGEHGADHDDHAHGEDDHSEDHDHDHGDHAEEASHTEFHATYQLTCENPSAITEMAFPYFEIFENPREIEVQVVTGSGARALTATRDTPTVDLTGLF